MQYEFQKIPDEYVSDIKEQIDFFEAVYNTLEGSDNERVKKTRRLVVEYNSSPKCQEMNALYTGAIAMTENALASELNCALLLNHTTASTTGPFNERYATLFYSEAIAGLMYRRMQWRKLKEFLFTIIALMIVLLAFGTIVSCLS